MRLDEAGDLAKALAGSHVKEVEFSDEEEDDIDNGCPGGGGAELASYIELSKYFGVRENHASGCGFTEASDLQD